MPYDNTNRGAVFNNERKNGPNHPDRTGNLTVLCPGCGEKHEFWVSGWLNTAGPNARNPGQRFLSLAVNPKEDVGGGYPSGSSPSNPEDFDEDIPF